MPRMANDSAPIPKKVAVEKDDWAEEQVMAGQNDYIDILGSDDLHPTDLMYNGCWSSPTCTICPSICSPTRSSTMSSHWLPHRH